MNKEKAFDDLLDLVRQSVKDWYEESKGFDNGNWVVRDLKNWLEGFDAANQQSSDT